MIYFETSERGGAVICSNESCNVIEDMSCDFMGINSWFWPRMFRQSVKIFNELFGDADQLSLTLISFSNS